MILVTGANGFVGQALCEELQIRNRKHKGVVRKIDSEKSKQYFAIGNIDSDTDWSNTLIGVECVIHCAARTHIMHEKNKNTLEAYRTINVEGTRQLAIQAASSGVKRLIYISSIKVNGEGVNIPSKKKSISASRRKITHMDAPTPKDSYSLSKWEAEQLLWDISTKTGLEVVIIRPPLVYGPRVKGNLSRLLKLIHLGIPLPFGFIKNKRSLIGLDNLIDLLIHCVDHPSASGRTFLVSDDEDISTPDLLHYIAKGLGRSVRLLPVPVPILYFLGIIIGKREEIDRLTGSFQIDSYYTRKTLGWFPDVSVEEGLRRMVKPK